MSYRAWLYPFSTVTPFYMVERHIETETLEQIIEQIWQFGPWENWRSPCTYQDYGV